MTLPSSEVVVSVEGADELTTPHIPDTQTSTESDPDIDTRGILSSFSCDLFESLC